MGTEQGCHFSKASVICLWQLDSLVVRALGLRLDGRKFDSPRCLATALDADTGLVHHMLCLFMRQLLQVPNYCLVTEANGCKQLTSICLCHQAVIWYLQKLGHKQAHHAMH